MNILKAGIDALVVIEETEHLLEVWSFNSEFDFPVMGIPGTIDNDIFKLVEAAHENAQKTPLTTFFVTVVK
jgi:6-phosphofructokinase